MRGHERFFWGTGNVLYLDVGVTWVCPMLKFTEDLYTVYKLYTSIINTKGKRYSTEELSV